MESREAGRAKGKCGWEPVVPKTKGGRDRGWCLRTAEQLCPGSAEKVTASPQAALRRLGKNISFQVEEAPHQGTDKGFQPLIPLGSQQPVQLCKDNL